MKKQPVKTDDFLTTVQAAEVIGLSPAHVRLLARLGHIEAVRHGRDWLILRSVAESYVRRPPGNPAWRKKVDSEQ